MKISNVLSGNVVSALSVTSLERQLKTFLGSSNPSVTSTQWALTIQDITKTLTNQRLATVSALHSLHQSHATETSISESAKDNAVIFSPNSEKQFWARELVIREQSM